MGTGEEDKKSKDPKERKPKRGKDKGRVVVMRNKILSMSTIEPSERNLNKETNNFTSYISSIFCFYLHGLMWRLMTVPPFYQ